MDTSKHHLSKSENYFDVDPQSYGDLLETFHDNLMDSGVINLAQGETIPNYGKGGVAITCLNKEEFTDEDGQLCWKQVVSLQFQADETPLVELTYGVFSDEEMAAGEEARFSHWVSARYQDAEGNEYPWNNSYFEEFVDDIQGVE